MANSVDPDQTAPIGAVCSGSMLFASILNLSVMLGNYLQQTTSADDIYQMHFFLGALRVKLDLTIQVAVTTTAIWVSYKLKYVHELLVNSLFKPAQEKV